jgi:hypothetical protein
MSARSSVGCGGDALTRSVTQPPAGSVTGIGAHDSLFELLSANSGARPRRRKVLLGCLPQRALS